MKNRSAFVNFTLADHLGNTVLIDIPETTTIYVWNNGKLAEKSFVIQKDMVVCVFGLLHEKQRITPYYSCIYIQVYGNGFLTAQNDSIPPPYGIKMDSKEANSYCSYTSKRSFIKSVICFSLCTYLLLTTYLFYLRAIKIEINMVLYLFWFVFLFFSFLYLKMSNIQLPDWQRIGQWQLNHFYGQTIGICGYVQYHRSCIESSKGLPCVYWNE